MLQDIFSEEATRMYAAELILAVNAVHTLGYAHRDLKPDNILIDTAGHLRLADLGLCKKVDPTSPWSPPPLLPSSEHQAKSSISCHPLTVQVNTEEEVNPSPQSPASDSPATSPAPPSQVFESIASPAREDSTESHLDGLRAVDERKPSSPRNVSHNSRRESTQRGKIFSTVGTPDYIAPEVNA